MIQITVAIMLLVNLTLIITLLKRKSNSKKQVSFDPKNRIENQLLSLRDFESEVSDKNVVLLKIVDNVEYRYVYNVYLDVYEGIVYRDMYCDTINDGLKLESYVISDAFLQSATVYCKSFKSFFIDVEMDVNFYKIWDDDSTIKHKDFMNHTYISAKYDIRSIRDILKNDSNSLKIREYCKLILNTPKKVIEKY